MTYGDLLKQSGLTCQQAASLHASSIDAVRAWSCGRRQAPRSVIEQLKKHNSTPVRTISVKADFSRVLSGPIKFGNDWPGVFLRGDEALGLANNIEIAQKANILPAEGPGGIMLQQIVERLRACEVNERG